MEKRGRGASVSSPLSLDAERRETGSPKHLDLAKKGLLLCLVPSCHRRLKCLKQSLRAEELKRNATRKEESQYALREVGTGSVETDPRKDHLTMQQRKVEAR